MPWDAAMPATVSFMRRSIISRPFGDSARQVPESTASSGMTLSAVPAWNWVTLTTTLSSGSLVRLAMVCKAPTICAPTTTGSTV